MKNFKTTLAAILAACAVLNLTGCAENRGGNASDLTVSDVGSPNDGGNGGNKGIIDSVDVTKTQFAPITLSDNNTLNSIRLFDAISSDKENAMFSPLSLNMALGLIEAGAEGDTKAAIDSYLRTENFPDFAERYMKRAREELTNKSGKENNVLEIANSLWADNALPLKDEYKQSMTGKFDAEIKNLDFRQKDNTLNEINGWVNEKTHKMIPSILEDYGENTMAVLVNTVYLDSAWSNEWDIDENAKETFTLPDGTTKELSLMYNKVGSYFENDNAAAFSCNYKNGLQFIGILPKNEGEFTLENLDIPTLLKSESYNYDVSAVMPRLNFETAFELKDALCAAGLQEIFDESRANFSGISEEELFVSKILQKTKLELNEKKTKASAATAITMETKGAILPRETKTVRLDRPFAFMIYDNAEQQILFVGKVTNP